MTFICAFLIWVNYIKDLQYSQIDFCFPKESKYNDLQINDFFNVFLCPLTL